MASCHYDLARLDAREVRTLCVSPKTAMRARLVAHLSATPDALKRWINFNGFVQAYFAQWRAMESPRAVEKLIQTMLGKGRILAKQQDARSMAQFPFPVFRRSFAHGLAKSSSATANQ